MFWFDKQDPRALFVDIREETHSTDTRPGRSPTVINPDIVADFTNLPFPDSMFRLVVFDPPHHTATGTRFRSVKKPGWAMLKYGWLGDDWRETLRAGFAECFRVLKPGGTLIFKWADKEIAVSDILKLTPHKPLFGHRSGKQATTHWLAFLKPDLPKKEKETICCCGAPLDGSHDHTTCGPPIEK
jgi:SAM-dependent methyltransferase